MTRKALCLSPMKVKPTPGKSVFQNEGKTTMEMTKTRGTQSPEAFTEILWRYGVDLAVEESVLLEILFGFLNTP